MWPKRNHKGEERRAGDGPFDFGQGGVIGEGDIFHLAQRLGREDIEDGGAQAIGRALARIPAPPGMVEGAPNDGGGAALGGIQVDVAGAHGEAVGFADDGAGDDFDAQVQVPHHRLDDAQLLRVLSPEIGARGRRRVEQLEHNGGDAAEVAGAGGAFQAGGDALDVDVGDVARRIHVNGCRQVDRIHASFAEEAQVARPRRAGNARSPRRRRTAWG